VPSVALRELARVGVEHHHVVEREHLAWAIDASSGADRSCSSSVATCCELPNSPPPGVHQLAVLQVDHPAHAGIVCAGRHGLARWIQKLQILRYGKLWLLMEN